MTSFKDSGSVGIREVNSFIYNETSQRANGNISAYNGIARSFVTNFIRVPFGVIPPTPPSGTEPVPDGWYSRDPEENQESNMILWVTFGKTGLSDQENHDIFEFTDPMQIIGDSATTAREIYAFRNLDYQGNITQEFLTPQYAVFNMTTSSVDLRGDALAPYFWKSQYTPLQSFYDTIYVAQGVAIGNGHDEEAQITWGGGVDYFIISNGTAGTGNISIGRKEYDPGPIFANLNIWGADLPNGSLDPPNSLHELYGSSIPQTSATLPRINLSPIHENYYNGLFINDNEFLEVPIYFGSTTDVTDPSELTGVTNHYIKYTAKLYDYNSSEGLGLSSSAAQTSRNKTLFPKEIDATSLDKDFISAINWVEWWCSRRLMMLYVNQVVSMYNFVYYWHDYSIGYRWTMLMLERNSQEDHQGFHMYIPTDFNGLSTFTQAGFGMEDYRTTPHWLGEISQYPELYERTQSFRMNEHRNIDIYNRFIYCSAESLTDWIYTLFTLPNDGRITQSKWKHDKSLRQESHLISRYYVPPAGGWGQVHPLWWYWQDGRWSWGRTYRTNIYTPMDRNVYGSMRGDEFNPSNYLHQYSPQVPYDSNPVWWTDHGRGSYWAKVYGPSVDNGTYTPIKASNHVKWKWPELDEHNVIDTILKRSPARGGQISENFQDPNERELIPSHLFTNRSPGVGFSKNGDSADHIFLSNPREEEADLVPPIYNRCEVAEGLFKVKEEDIEFLGEIEGSEGQLNMWRVYLKIPMDSLKRNFSNFEFHLDGITPLGIEKRDGKYHVENGFDVSYATERDIDSKQEAVDRWSKFVYDQRYHQSLGRFYYNIPMSFWGHTIPIEKQKDSNGNILTFSNGDIKYREPASLGYLYAISVAYEAAGYSNENRYSISNDNNNFSSKNILPGKSYGGKIKFIPEYKIMLPSRVTVEFERVFNFLENLLSYPLDSFLGLEHGADWYIFVNIQEIDSLKIGTSTLASAGPRGWENAAFSQNEVSHNAVNTMVVNLDPFDLAQDSNFELDGLGRTSWYNIILHEVLHGIGFGFLDGSFFNNRNNSPGKYENSLMVNEFGTQYQNLNGLQQYQQACAHYGLTDPDKYYFGGVPMQRGGFHLAEYSKTDTSLIQPSFNNELMTPLYNGIYNNEGALSSNPLSKISGGILMDMGFGVDLSLLDSFDNLIYNIDFTQPEWSSSYDQFRKFSSRKPKPCACGHAH